MLRPGAYTCAWPNKYSNSGSPCPLQQRQPARTACSARDGVQQRWFKGRHGHDCNCATQRAVRGPRPAPALTREGPPRPHWQTTTLPMALKTVDGEIGGELGCPGPRARRPRTLQSTQHKTRVRARCGGGAQEQQGPKANAPRPCCPNHTRALATRHREKEVALGMHGGYRVAGHPSTLTGDPINVDVDAPG